MEINILGAIIMACIARDFFNDFKTWHSSILVVGTP
jgi:hypothetical protein